MQMIGAIAVLIPRTFLLGIAMLVCTMLGAVVGWIFLLGAPFNAIFPGALLAALIVIAGRIWPIYFRGQLALIVFSE